MKRLYVVMLATMLLCGCGQKGSETQINTDFLENDKEVTVMIGGGRSEVKNGYLMKIINQQLVAYFDCETKVLVPLCTKADCTHSIEERGEASCTAVLLGYEAMKLGIYEGKLWYLNGNEYNVLEIWQADITGENAKKMYTLEGHAPSGTFIYDGHMYLHTRKFLVNELGMMEGLEESIFRVNLENGEFFALEEPKHLDIPTFELVGLSDGVLYVYHYEQSEEYPGGALVMYDCETGEKSVFAKNPGKYAYWGMNQNFIVSTSLIDDEGVISIIDLATGKKVDQLIFDKKRQFIIFEEEILIPVDDNYCRYTFADRNFEVLNTKALFGKFYPKISTGDGYLGDLADKEVCYGCGYIDKESFDQGGKPVELYRD